MDLLKQLNWRYATKKFDNSRKLSPELLNKLLEATNLSASSFGLQPYNVLVIENDELREKLKSAAWNQPQLTDASQVIVFAANNNLSANDADNFIKHVAQVRNLPLEALNEYGDMIKSSIQSRPQEVLTAWAARQAYIALGFLLVSCAIEQVDACPMEGFDNDKFDELLDLKSKGLTSVVMATIGYRAKDDGYQHLKKVRKPLNELIIKY